MPALAELIVDTAWVRRYNGPWDGSDGAVAIALGSSDNVYVTGWSCRSFGDCDYLTVKYQANGDTTWVRCYNGLGDSADGATGIAVDASENIYVTGGSWGSGTGFDYATIKYDSSGNELWAKRYNGPENRSDIACAIAVDDSGWLYVTGATGDGINDDYLTIKYVQTGTDVKDETGNREKPSEFALSQNYPNPFNQTTKIQFTLAKSGFVTLNIYDLLGRNVRTLVSEILSSGYKSVLWDGKNDLGKDVASGIYFYQLRVGDLSETKKLILLK